MKVSTTFFIFLIFCSIFCLFKIVFVFAIVACAVAIPAGAPQPRPVNAPVQRQRAANPESEQLQSGAEDQDLKGSSSYGYGWEFIHRFKLQKINLNVWLNSCHSSYYGGLGGLGAGGYYGGLGYYPYSYSSGLLELDFSNQYDVILLNI